MAAVGEAASAAGDFADYGVMRFGLKGDGAGSLEQQKYTVA